MGYLNPSLAVNKIRLLHGNIIYMEFDFYMGNLIQIKSSSRIAYVFGLERNNRAFIIW